MTRLNEIKLLQGDITLADVNAIVNAANPKMLGGGGVDGAIHRAAGPKLLQACRQVKAINGVRCPIGHARITDSGNLAAKKVIHTVGPRYSIDVDPEQLLVNAYRSCLDLALENHLTSIAFPAISCGAYGYPAREAAQIAVSICQDQKYARLSIFFYLFTDSAMKAWQAAINND